MTSTQFSKNIQKNYVSKPTSSHKKKSSLDQDEDE
jgi:hypothetical protein